MSTRDDGGPAFPREDYQGDSAPGQSGMTLRDYFAAQCLPDGITGEEKYEEADLAKTAATVARRAYAVADAMIAERDK